MTMHTFTVSTWADSRSNRRDRTYVVEAVDAEAAGNEAIMLAFRDIRHWVSIYPTITDVDGNGPPVHCEHVAGGDTGPRTMRWDGGWDCQSCVPLGVVNT